MSRFLRTCLPALATGLVLTTAAAASDPEAGAAVFRKCQACHAVGEGAQNRVGPQLNDLFGRTAGGLEDYRYSPAMVKAGEDGLVWNEESLAAYLASPRGVVKGTKMAFAGLKAEADRDNVLAYLATFSSAEAPAAEAETPEPAEAETAQAEMVQPEPAPAATAPAAPEGAAAGDGLVLKLGREATAEEVAAWDIDIRPDGLGLPDGRGTVADGMFIYDDNCAACHGDFGEGIGRWPVLAGGQGTLTHDRPNKTVGSYWPYLSTVYDYVRRTMPFGNARSLSDDEVYALTAYILYLNDIVVDEDFELSKDTFATIEMPNEPNFKDDDRPEEAHYTKDEPCMTDCVAGKAEIKMHAAVLDVTPEDTGDNEAPAVGIE